MGTKEKIEDIFKRAHASEKKHPAPVFSSGWQSRVMDDVRRESRLAVAGVGEEYPLNAFAFRAGCAMLGLAIAVSLVFYTMGTNQTVMTASSSNSSLWEIVDQSVNTYDVSLFRDTAQANSGKVE